MTTDRPPIVRRKATHYELIARSRSFYESWECPSDMPYLAPPPPGQCAHDGGFSHKPFKEVYVCLLCRAEFTEDSFLDIAVLEGHAR